MVPESAKSYPGQQVVHALPVTEPTPEVQPDVTVSPVERAKQEIDYGRRGKGYIFGAFRPATGEAFTRPYGGRTIANWVDFLEQVEHWLPEQTQAERIYAIVDNLSVHRATDVLLFVLAHPRWEFVFQPKYAAYLDRAVVKILRSLALKGRRFETWEAICQAVEAATAYWNQHRHPFIWGRRRRHQLRRRPGIALVPAVS